MADCPFDACPGNGWKAIQDGNVSRVTRCECWLQKTQKCAAQVPDYFADARLANYRERQGNKHAIAAARAWGKATTGDLYLHGGVGTGKTRLACSLLNERFLDGDRSAYFCRVPFLMLLQLQGIDDPEKKGEANRMLDRCLEAAALVLDDVAGAENASDFSRRTMVTLYDQRLDRGRRTIWTSNLSLGDLTAFYGDARLPSRIAGACAEVLELGGSDFRLEGTRY